MGGLYWIYWKINDPQNALTRSIDKALNIAEKANNLNSKALEAEDMWFSKPMYSVALAGYMKANGLTEITDAARTYAMTEAKRGTYNDLNAVSKWATSLGKGSKLGRFLSSTVYPFKKVPANVMVRTVEYSPLGYLPACIWYAAVNMMRSDYCMVARKHGVDKPEFYADMAQAFLLDKDAGEPEEKIAAYYHCVANANKNANDM